MIYIWANSRSQTKRQSSMCVRVRTFMWICGRKRETKRRQRERERERESHAILNHCSMDLVSIYWYRTPHATSFDLPVWRHNGLTRIWALSTEPSATSVCMPPSSTTCNHDIISHIFSSIKKEINWRRKIHTRTEGNVLFNDALNTFYLRLYGIRYMVKNQSGSFMGYFFRLAARDL